MDFFYMFQNFILYPVKELIGYLNDDAFKNMIFGGQATYWQVICCFIVGALLIRFLLSPVRLSIGSHSFLSQPLEPVEVNSSDPHSSSSDPWGVKMR